jgi:hypothetical protein
MSYLHAFRVDHGRRIQRIDMFSTPECDPGLFPHVTDAEIEEYMRTSTACVCAPNAVVYLDNAVVVQHDPGCPASCGYGHPS